jgi:hypothetical protein
MLRKVFLIAIAMAVLATTLLATDQSQNEKIARDFVSSLAAHRYTEASRQIGEPLTKSASDLQKD